MPAHIDMSGQTFHGVEILRVSHKNARHEYHYGGRGIRVCDRWLDFRNFLADMGGRPTRLHSIDRIDNDGNYEPGNVRWATKREQSLNRRNRRLPVPCQHCHRAYLKHSKTQRFCSYVCRGAATKGNNILDTQDG